MDLNILLNFFIVFSVWAVLISENDFQNDSVDANNNRQNDVYSGDEVNYLVNVILNLDIKEKHVIGRFSGNHNNLYKLLNILVFTLINNFIQIMDIKKNVALNIPKVVNVLVEVEDNAVIVKINLIDQNMDNVFDYEMVRNILDITLNICSSKKAM